MTGEKERADVVLRLGRDARLAHATLFRHRHPQETPPFHYEMIDLWHSPAPQALTIAFRGAAKSTIAEEAITIMALYERFNNCIILGENEARAKERLGAIKNEIETNQYIEELFGVLKGSVWQESKIVLGNGKVIQAFGRGQSLRGAKHLQWRPDLVFGDDMEDEESVATEDARDKFKNWFMKVVVPALAPGARVRIAGTPLDPKSFIMLLKKSPDWKTKVFPIEYYESTTGNRRATWPARFPLNIVDTIRDNYRNVGSTQEFAQEYLCEPSDPATKAFTAEMVKVEPVVRAWQPVYAMYDPARTVKLRSAETGVVVFSWVGSRLVLWDAYGRKMMPDDIINDVFRVNEQYQPVSIGFEETGLSEWAMQPLRQEQVRRGVVLPLVPLNAPRSKLDFIKGLQPFFKAGEVIFAKELPELVKQMLEFPTGRLDVINALAYAPRIRPGQPVYDNFSARHVTEGLQPALREPLYLVFNASGPYVSAVAMQLVQGAVFLLADWIREGDPGAVLQELLQAASLQFARQLVCVAGPQHFKQHDTVGLRAAARKVPVELRKGGEALRGREELRRLFDQMRHGFPAVQVASGARTSLNAFASGYAREVNKDGALSDFPRENVYKVIMEGIESFVALAQSGFAAEAQAPAHYETTADGRRFVSARAVR